VAGREYGNDFTILACVGGFPLVQRELVHYFALWRVLVLALVQQVIVLYVLVSGTCSTQAICRSHRLKVLQPLTFRCSLIWKLCLNGCAPHVASRFPQSTNLGSAIPKLVTRFTSTASRRSRKGCRFTKSLVSHHRRVWHTICAQFHAALGAIAFASLWYVRSRFVCYVHSELTSCAE
jgi:hypothetical protein